jgi:uncharacterized protein GlcG (DUF336 family)
MKSIEKRSISVEAARKLLDAAVEKAREIGVPFNIAVTDEAGDMKAFVRMDGAIKLGLDISLNKAFTSASTGLPSDKWFEYIKEDAPLLHGITHTPRFVVFGGGMPIMDGDHLIGAVGVSGGHYTQDMEVAKAGLAALG